MLLLFMTNSPLMVMLHWCFFNRLPFKELLFLLFFFLFCRAFRVELFHFFHLTGRHCGKVANEMNQFPGILSRRVGAAPSGHAAQSDAIFDDVEQLTVGHSLSAFLPHVWGGRIHPLPHLGLAATVVSMTQSAVIGPMRFRVR